MDISIQPQVILGKTATKLHFRLSDDNVSRCDVIWELQDENNNAIASDTSPIVGDDYANWDTANMTAYPKNWILKKLNAIEK